MSETDDNKALDLTKTARAEIDLNQELEDIMNRLDDEWRKEREKLAATPLPAPSLGPGITQERSLHAEYEALRSNHDYKIHAIRDEHTQARASLRDQGTTLSGEFKKTTEHPAVRTQQPLTPVFQAASQALTQPDQTDIRTAGLPPENDQEHSRSR